MPITLPESLPAYSVLKREGVSVMSDALAARQDIRPLRIALLNLMPKKSKRRTNLLDSSGQPPCKSNLA